MIKKLDWKPPQGGIAFIAGCFIVGSIFFIATGGSSWYTRWVCPLFLPVGLGLWLKQQWARWVAFAFFTAVGGLLIFSMVQQGLSVRASLRALVVLGSLFVLWDWDVYGEDDFTA